MTTEQTLHPSDEPEDDRPDLLLRLSKWWVFVAIGAFLLYSVVLGFTTISSYLNTKAHSSEIAAIRQTQLDNSNGQKTVNHDAAVIGAAAEALSSQIAANHTGTKSGQIEVCNALDVLLTAQHLGPLCVIPS